MKTKTRIGLQTLKACLALFRIQTAVALQYRVAALVNSSTGIFWALIEATVYTVFYKYAANRGAAIPLSLSQMMSYIWLNQAIWSFMLFDIDGDIRMKISNGDVGVELCRPLELYSHWFARGSAERAGKGDILTNASYQVTRVPMDYMPRLMKNTFTFIMPLLVISYYPAAVICGWSEKAWMGFLPLPAGLAFMGVSMAVWRFGVRRYQSTGS